MLERAHTKKTCSKDAFTNFTGVPICVDAQLQDGGRETHLVTCESALEENQAAVRVSFLFVEFLVLFCELLDLSLKSSVFSFQLLHLDCQWRQRCFSFPFPPETNTHRFVTVLVLNTQ